MASTTEKEVVLCHALTVAQHCCPLGRRLPSHLCLAGTRQRIVKGSHHSSGCQVEGGMTGYDLLAEPDADDECRAWARRLIHAGEEVVADSRLDGHGAGEYLGFFKGSFNLCYHIGFEDRHPSTIIHFTKPGHISSTWQEEKVMNEVRVVDYLRKHTTVSVPNIRCWGLSDESPTRLGPFTIMDFIEGVRLLGFLRENPDGDEAELVLNPVIDGATLGTIYGQLAEYLLQLSRLEFPSIGAISKRSGRQRLDR